MTAAPEHELGPEVCPWAHAVGLPGFLALAGKLGGGVLYLRAVPFDPGSGDDPREDPPAHLAQHQGKVGQVSIAFAANGLVHFWEHQTAWHREWQELADSPPTRPGFHNGDKPERLSAEERARVASELADTILADPRFRPPRALPRTGSPGLAIPKDTDSWAG